MQRDKTSYFHQTACKIRYDNLSIRLGTRSLAPESKLFQSHSYAEIPGQANREEPLSHFKLK